MSYGLAGTGHAPGARPLRLCAMSPHRDLILASLPASSGADLPWSRRPSVAQLHWCSVHDHDKLAVSSYSVAFPRRTPANCDWPAHACLSTLLAMSFLTCLHKKSDTTFPCSDLANGAEDALLHCHSTGPADVAQLRSRTMPPASRQLDYQEFPGSTGLCDARLHGSARHCGHAWPTERLRFSAWLSAITVTSLLTICTHTYTQHKLP